MAVFLEMKNIVKQFPGVLALDHVNLKVNKGEVHALLGENGAGKSTLMKVLSGAYSKDERELFELIVGISGIGASSARMILSAMSADEFREAILSENSKKISSVKGIGVKSAQRMILELKDKIVKGEGVSKDILFAPDNNTDVDEATRALVMLGFSKPNINKAIQAILKKTPGAKVEEIIKQALKIL